VLSGIVHFGALSKTLLATPFGARIK